MIYLYYTGAQADGAQQSDITKSLGGFISGTVIPNSRINSLFRDVSQRSAMPGNTETICIAIKNTSAAKLNNFTLYCELQVGSTTYIIEAAAVKPTKGPCGAYLFEKLRASDELPYYGEFNNIVTVANAINIGSIEPNEFIGLFITKKFITPNPPVDTCIPVDFEKQTDADLSEEIKFNFSWD